MRWNRHKVKFSLLKDWLSWLAIFFVVIFCFRSLVAHSGPIYYQGGFWSESDVSYSEGIWAPIPFDGTEISLEQRFKKPLSRASDGRIHYLGTDALGRDIAGGIVHAFRRSIVISFLAMGFALLIGLCLGVSSAWFGNKLRIPLILLIYMVITLSVFTYFIAFGKFFSVGQISIYSFSLLGVGILIYFWIRNKSSFYVKIPLDSIVLRMLEVFRSVPTLVIILAISPLIISGSITSFALLISLFTWPVFTRLARAETLKVRSEEFIQHAKSSGYSALRISFVHLLPNIRTSLLIAFCFGIASVILFESSLSFLGIGPFTNEPSLGGMLKEARIHWNAWWLSLFPGLMIFLMILFFRELVGRLERENLV